MSAEVPQVDKPLAPSRVLNSNRTQMLLFVALNFQRWTGYIQARL
jgi:hypothetical protein